MNTAEKLASALEAVPGMPAAIVQRARDGYYDDFRSPLTFPLHTLVRDLKDVKNTPSTPRDSRLLIGALIRDVKDGEFDGTLEEAEAWGRSPEGRAILRELGLG